MKRGDIFWANLAPRSGSEQRGRRPVVVISHNIFNQNQNWRSIIIVPISTSEAQAKRGLTGVLIPQGTANLSKDSVALCHQVTTLDRAKFEGFIGTLPARIINEIKVRFKSRNEFNLKRLQLASVSRIN